MKHSDINLLKNEKGISLIEVIVSIALLGVVSMLFITIMGTINAVTQDSMETTEGSMKAAACIEQTQVSGSDDIFSIEFETGEKWDIKGEYIEQNHKMITYQLFIPSE